jgi:hypothetical protein
MSYIGHKLIHVCLDGAEEPSLSVSVEWVLMCGLRSLGYSDFTVSDIKQILAPEVQINEPIMMAEDGKTWS